MKVVRGSRAGTSHVAILVHDLGASGVVRNAIALANRLAQAGRPVELVAVRAEGVLAASVTAGVRVVDLGIRGRGRTAELRRCIPGLRRHLEASAPALVLSAGNHFHLTCRIATLGLGLRVAYRISNSLEHVRGGRRSPRQRLRRVLLRWIAASADQLFLVSRSLIGEIGGVRATVIENGVDLDAVRRRAGEPAAFPLDRTMPQILSVGRLCAQKNYETLIHAVARANTVRPIGLAILGGGPRRYRAALSKLAHRLEIGDRVRFHDPVANPHAIMAQADAIALPSWWEGSSNVLLEALACSRPIVASATAGNAAEVLGQGRYGCLVDPGDRVALAASLLRQIGDRPILPGDRAEHYALEITLDRYVAAIDALIARPVRGRRAERGVAGRWLGMPASARRA